MTVEELWLKIWKSHWSYQKWLTVDQSVIAEKEMRQELEGCITKGETQ